MIKDKPCKVCALLKEDLSFSDYINSRLKNNVKISEIRDDFKNPGQAPSKYYLEEHKNKCLKDFKAKTIQPSLTLKNTQKEKDEDTTFADVNIIEELERYRNMSFEEKKENHIKRLKEIIFMTAIRVHYQLIYGRGIGKSNVPKEDIAALKQMEDVVLALTSDNFDDEEIPEININVRNTALENKDILESYDFTKTNQSSNETEHLNIKDNNIDSTDGDND